MHESPKNVCSALSSAAFKKKDLDGVSKFESIFPCFVFFKFFQDPITSVSNLVLNILNNALCVKKFWSKFYKYDLKI